MTIKNYQKSIEMGHSVFQALAAHVSNLNYPISSYITLNAEAYRYLEIYLMSIGKLPFGSVIYNILGVIRLVYIPEINRGTYRDLYCRADSDVGGFFISTTGQPAYNEIMISRYDMGSGFLQEYDKSLVALKNIAKILYPGTKNTDLGGIKARIIGGLKYEILGFSH